MFRHVIRALVLVLFAVLPGTAQTTSAVTGTVTDSSSGILPGVTVDISGPSLTGLQTAVTDEEGVYRFVGVPPGVYTLIYELPGFARVTREEIELTANVIAVVNVAMGTVTLGVNVTVTGNPPGGDVPSRTVPRKVGKDTGSNLTSARD
jgi:carboxypeptidase family protein